MYGSLPYFTLGLFFIDIFTFCLCINRQDPNATIRIDFFEYGTHVQNEEVSLAKNGEIPPFTPVFKLNVTPEREDLEKRFSYLRVEYVSPMSTVEIKLDEENLILIFYIKFPFMSIPYGVVGYSVKADLRSQMWTIWRRFRKRLPC